MQYSTLEQAEAAWSAKQDRGAYMIRVVHGLWGGVSYAVVPR